MGRAGKNRMVAAAALVLALLAGCGGGGDGASGPDVSEPASCSVDDQKLWLRDYMADWYFWYAASPRPDPAPYASVQSYFDALLYTGTLSAFPADRWSYTQSSSEHDLFYGEGRTMGYGLFVAGIEILSTPSAPLRVRYIEPQSPAALAGLARGDQVLSVNGRAASDLVAANDFTALSPQATGEQVTLQVRDAAGTTRTVVLTAAVYTLTPVSTWGVIDTGSGRRTGYLVLKDFIEQAGPSLETAFANFKSAGVDDLVIDLRYNGGGLVTTAATLASYVGGWRTEGKVFASLLYNDRHAGENQSFRFGSLLSGLGVTRVYVLSGQRTCSASELVVNGLRPFVDVVIVGDTTCGKPVGFLPISRCGTTYSAVNFETVNARNEGRYFDGLQPTCAVADDLDHALGSPAEALLATARYHAANGTCPAGTAAGTARALGFKGTQPRVRGTEPGEHPGMFVR
jgi:hypothetical protein